jgi:hypothetical protein
MEFLGWGVGKMTKGFIIRKESGFKKKIEHVAKKRHLDSPPGARLGFDAP